MTGMQPRTGGLSQTGHDRCRRADFNILRLEDSDMETVARLYSPETKSYSRFESSSAHQMA